MESVVVEHGTTKDVGVLMRHRKSLWMETGSWKETDLEAAVTKYESWLRNALGDGKVIPFLARIDKAIAGSGSIWIRDIRPAPARPKLSEAVLIGMYTEPEFRRRKVASSILEAAIKWSSANGFDELVLHTSDQGRSLYKKRGFGDTSEMRLRLD